MCLFTIFFPWKNGQFLSWTNVFDCWYTSTASGLRLVSTMLRKTNFLSKSTLSSPSNALYPALISAQVLLCQLYLHPVSQTGFVPASGLLVVSFSSPPPAHQLTCAGLCHVAIYIYPKPALIGILIECAPLSRLSCHTACSLVFFFYSCSL